MYKPELNLLTSFVFYFLLYDYQVEAEGLLDEQRKLSLVESLIKQVSFSVSSNMN